MLPCRRGARLAARRFRDGSPSIGPNGRALYRPACSGLITLGEVIWLIMHGSQGRGGSLLCRLRRYLVLIADEARRAYDGRRRVPLDKPVVTRQWLTLEQCARASQQDRKDRTPGR